MGARRSIQAMVGLCFALDRAGAGPVGSVRCLGGAVDRLGLLAKLVSQSISRIGRFSSGDGAGHSFWFTDGGE